jgi:hypothetical protein
MLIDTIDAVLSGCNNLDAPQELMSQVINLAKLRIDLPHDREVCYRGSSIGKPWILQVLNRWYPSPTVFTVGSMMVMTDGIIAQAWAEYILTLAKVQFTSEPEFSMNFGAVKVVGHSDIVCTRGNEIVVIECKSMAAHLISGFANCPNDDYGYLSQLSFYVGAVKRLNPMREVIGLFLLYDRSNGKFRTVQVLDSVLAAKWNRISNALEKVAAIPQYDLRQLLSVVAVPPPINGKIPTSMKWSRWAKAFYRTTTEKGQYEMYDPEESIRIIETITQNLI